MSDWSARRNDVKELLVTILESWHYLIEERASCGVCGERFAIGDPEVGEPADDLTGIPGTIISTHAYCAMRNGYTRFRWPTV